jgi:hypothetical protein
MSSLKPRPSRRKFLALLAAGTVAVATSPVSTIAAQKTSTTTKSRTKSTTAPVKSRVTPFEAEIERQKKDVAKTLKVIRDYQMAPGSEPAFVFLPMPALPKRKPS